MNTLMYDHPLTDEHLRVVRDVIGYNVVGPIGKALACGDVGACQSLHPSVAMRVERTPSISFAWIGLGAMTEWKEIVGIVAQRYKLMRTGPKDAVS